MYREYAKPLADEDNLKGIIRANKVKVKTTGNLGQYPNDESAVIRNDYSKYWHSIQDENFTQYLQIDFRHIFAEVTSYSFYTGNNNNSYDKGVSYYQCWSKNWNISCSPDGVKYEVIDYHIDEKEVNRPNQQIIFDMKKVKVCSSYRILITGKDNNNRALGYVGPIEFFGKIYMSRQPRSRCLQHNRNLNLFLMVLVS